jgi:hypothetical protein
MIKCGLLNQLGVIFYRGFNVIAPVIAYPILIHCFDRKGILK